MNSSEKDHIAWQLNINKAIIDIEKNQTEIRKLMADTLLSDSTREFTNKKVKWYEITMILAVVGVVIALTKIFL